MAKRIFIVEDEEDQLESLIKELTNGYQVIITPDDLGCNKNQDGWLYIVDNIKQNNFTAFTLNDYDLYVVDIYFDSQPLGLNFIKYLVENKKIEPTKIIAISNSRDKKKEVRTIDPTIHYIFKFDTLNVMDRAQKIGEIGRLPLRNDKGGNENGIIKNFHISKGKLDGFNKWLNQLVLLIFSLLIAATTLSAFVHILLEVYKSFLSDSGVLKLAESIFLNVIPVFIVLGFYSFYQIEPQAYLIGRYEKGVSENPTRLLNVTKILFMSSIVSFTVVMILEKLGEHEPGGSYVELISLGILLIILMIFYLILDKNHH